MEETLEIKYLISAQDQATATLQKIDKVLNSINKATEKTTIATESMSMAQEEANGIMKKNEGVLISVAKAVAGLGVAIAKDVLILGSFAAATFAAYKSFNGFARLVNAGAKSISFLNYVIVDSVNKAQILQKTQQVGIGVFAKLKNAILTSNIASKISNATLNASIVANDFLMKALVRVEGAHRFVGKSAKAGVAALMSYKEGLLVTGRAALGTGKNIVKAALATEIFQKGIFGLTAKVASFGVGLVGIGQILASFDSKIAKIAGISLIALSAAMFGIATVIKSLIASVGGLIQAFGTRLVNAGQSAIKTMREMNDKAFAFAFVINSLQRETRGATGSLEEWNQAVLAFSNNTGYAVSETQNAVSELTRVGESLGLTKRQMLDLIPVIGDLAAVNHRDLFDATLAVVEALGGQTIMLQNMGVSLTQHALAETKAAKAMGKRITKLSDSEKVQLRFNALLEKSTTIQGFAAASLSTTEGASRLLDTSMKNLAQSFGEGAEMVEGRWNVSVARAVNFASGLSEDIVRQSGFLTALGGRILQVVGFFIKWSVAIILVQTSLVALNILLKDQAISRFLLYLSQTNFLTLTLAKSFPVLAASIRTSLASMAASGVGLTSVMAVLKATLLGVARAALAALAPFLLIAAKVAVVVGIFYLIYQALKRIDDQTKIFTNTWRVMVSLWERSGVFEAIGEAVHSVAIAIQTGLINAIFGLSKWIVKMNLRWLDFKIAVLDAKNQIIDFGDFLVGYLKKAPSAMLKLLGIQSAYADELKRGAEANRDVARGSDKQIESIKKTIEARKQLIENLDAAKKAEIAAITESTERNLAGEEEKRKEHGKTFNLIQSLNAAKKAIAKEEEELGKIEAELKSVSELEKYNSFLNDKELLKIVYQARELELEGKHTESLEKMLEFRRKLEEKHLKQKAGSMESFFSLERNKALAEQKWEKATFKERLGTMRDTFNSIVSLSNAKNSSLRAIGKAAAVTTASIDGVLAVQKTLASVPYPFSIPLAAAVGAAAAANVARISGIATFREGGVVEGPKAGDQNIVRANGDEMFLTKAQQGRLFNMINKGGTGNNEDISEAINNLAMAIKEQPVIMEANGRELARVIRDERIAGVRI